MNERRTYTWPTKWLDKWLAKCMCVYMCMCLQSFLYCVYLLYLLLFANSPYRLMHFLYLYMQCFNTLARSCTSVCVCMFIAVLIVYPSIVMVCLSFSLSVYMSVCVTIFSAVITLLFVFLWQSLWPILLRHVWLPVSISDC